MSDASQGPGWWLASDGRWYPPEQAPAPSPAWGAQASLPGPVVARGLTQGAQIALALAAGLNLLLAIAALVAHGALTDAIDSGVDALLWNEAIDAEDKLVSMATATVIGQVLSTIVLVVWMWRAHGATERLRPGARKWSRGWTIAGWLIPIANLVLPRRVMTEIERIAVSPRDHGRVAHGWQEHRTAVLGWAWWLLLVAGIVLGRVADSAIDTAVFDPASIRDAYREYAFAAIATAVGLVCAIPYIGRIGVRLTADAFAESNGSAGPPA